jgi:hypothetical protein
MLGNICWVEWGLEGEERSSPPDGHSVANPTGYSWRVALPQSPLPLHRLRRSVKGRNGRVKKKVENSGLTGSKERAKLASRIENQPALRGTNTA